METTLQEQHPPAAASRPWWSVGGVLEYSSRITPQRLVLLFVAGNFAFLAWDVYLAHAFTRRYFKVLYEWIPVFASPVAALAGGLMAMSPRPSRAKLAFHLLAMAGMVVVGVVGFAMHLFAAIGIGKHLTWEGLVHAAPLLAPLSFAGVGLVGIVAAAREDPQHPGRLELLGGRIAAPFSQQQHLHLLNGLGLLAATLLAAIDHSQTNLANPVIWIPIVGGFLLTGLVLHHALLPRPRQQEKLVYFWGMLAAIVIGLIGFAMHLEHDLAGTGEFTLERLFKAAPPFAPLLFANMGVLGVLALIEPVDAHS